MNHIVERLKEKRDIEIAKSILESNGYRVSKRSNSVKESKRFRKPMRRVKEATGTYEWSGEWQTEYGNPCRVKYYSTSYDMTDEVIGAVYEPDGNEWTDYGVSIIDNTGELIAGTGYDEDADGFSSEAEAKRWVEDWFNKNNADHIEGEHSNILKWSGMRYNHLRGYHMNTYADKDMRYHGVVDTLVSAKDVQKGYSHRAWIIDGLNGMNVTHSYFSTEEEAKQWVENWFANNKNEKVKDW